MKPATNWELTAHSLPNFVEFVSQQFLQGKRSVKIKIQPDKRTIPMNSMIYGLYQQIAAAKEDETVIDIRRHCKAYYGVPILLAGDPAFAAMYTKGIMPHLTVEEKLEAMDILPVSSRMSKAQGCEYIDTIIREYSKAGISLMPPGEAEYA